MRFFNTAGPVNCTDHYCLPPLERIDLEKTLTLIDQKKYFILHAPRQTGKTTCLLALMDHLNNTGKFRALYFNVEMAQAAREDVARGMRAILSEMASRAYDFLLEQTIEKGLQQISAYMDRAGTEDGHLVIFDRDKDKSGDNKIFDREETYLDKKINVWGM